MLLGSPEAFRVALTAEGRVLGMDHGSRTIGVAVSDARRRIASPVITLARKNLAQEIAALGELIATHAIKGLVIGYPLNMDGSEGPRCQSVRAFVRNLEPHFDLPIVLWDERLSSHAAEEALLKASLSRSKSKDKVDKVAAALILQGLLDKLHEAG